MNPTFDLPTPPGAGGRVAHDALEARFGRRLAARLTEGAEALPHDLSERLRFAREQALQRARAASTVPAAAPATAGGPSLGGSGPGFWWRLASVLPGIALVAGLVLIEMQHDDEVARTAADIDAALLSDDLPPTAYTDPGFAEYLKDSGS
jgi:hypothetical protein